MRGVEIQYEPFADDLRWGRFIHNSGAMAGVSGVSISYY